LLILISRRQRKIKVRPIRKVEAINPPDIIGKKLYKHQESPSEAEDAEQHKPAQIPAKPIKDDKQNWSQTTKEWRKATEQIRLLRREVTKHKRTEEQLRQKISELTNSGRQNPAGLKECEHKGHNSNPGTSMPQTFEILDIQAESSTKQLTVNKAVSNNKYKEDIPEDKHTQNVAEKKADELTTPREQVRQEIANNPNHSAEPIVKEVTNSGNSKRHVNPLDINELESVAALAKRLRRTKHQKQNT
jgi:hypothetical protein